MMMIGVILGVSLTEILSCIIIPNMKTLYKKKHIIVMLSINLRVELKKTYYCGIINHICRIHKIH